MDLLKELLDKKFSKKYSIRYETTDKNSELITIEHYKICHRKPNIFFNYIDYKIVCEYIGHYRCKIKIKNNLISVCTANIKKFKSIIELKEVTKLKIYGNNRVKNIPENIIEVSIKSGFVFAEQIGIQKISLPKTLKKLDVSLISLYKNKNLLNSFECIEYLKVRIDSSTDHDLISFKNDEISNIFNNLPSTLKTFIFNTLFPISNPYFDNLPESLITIAIIGANESPLDFLPNSVQYLMISNGYKINLENLPTNLKYLDINSSSNINIILPDTIKYAIFSNNNHELASKMRKIYGQKIKETRVLKDKKLFKETYYFENYKVKEYRKYIHLIHYKNILKKYNIPILFGPNFPDLFSDLVIKIDG